MSFFPYIERVDQLEDSCITGSPKETEIMHIQLQQCGKCPLIGSNMTKKHPGAAEFMQLFAFLHADVILLEFLRAGKDSLTDHLGSHFTDIPLTTGFSSTRQSPQIGFSLITRINQGRGVRIHRLVQEAVQLEMEETAWIMWWERIVNLCQSAYPRSINEVTRPTCRKFEVQATVPLLKCPMPSEVKPKLHLAAC